MSPGGPSCSELLGAAQIERLIYLDRLYVGDVPPKEAEIMAADWIRHYPQLPLIPHTAGVGNWGRNKEGKRRGWGGR